MTIEKTKGLFVDIHHLAVVRNALTAYVAMKKSPVAQRVASDPWELDVALCSVKLGDVVALERWLGRIEVALGCGSTSLNDEILTALKLLLSEWKDLELHAGTGALLDYVDCLKSSPAFVVGYDRIDNAKALQKSETRVPGDPYWALDFVALRGLRPATGQKDRSIGNDREERVHHESPLPTRTVEADAFQRFS